MNWLIHPGVLLLVVAIPCLRQSAGAERPNAPLNPEQVVNNLLSNAIKYSSPDQPVHFSVREEMGQAVFTVEDHGVGIPEADHLVRFNGTSWSAMAGANGTIAIRAAPLWPVSAGCGRLLLCV